MLCNLNLHILCVTSRYLYEAIVKFETVAAADYALTCKSCNKIMFVNIALL